MHDSASNFSHLNCPKGNVNHECDVSKENQLSVDLKRTKLFRCNLNTGKQKENDSCKYLAVCGA